MVSFAHFTASKGAGIFVTEKWLSLWRKKYGGHFETEKYDRNTIHVENVTEKDDLRNQEHIVYVFLCETHDLCWL